LLDDSCFSVGGVSSNSDSRLLSIIKSGLQWFSSVS